MDYLTIGSITIPYSWLAFLGAVFVLDWLTKKNKEAELDTYLFLYLLIWKGSYVVFYTHAFLDAPLSLLYFDGGMKGHYFAIFVTILLLIRKRQSIQLESLWQGFLLFTAGYHLILSLLQQNWLLVVLAIAALVSSRKTVHATTFFVVLLVFIQYPFYAVWPTLLFAMFILLLALGGKQHFQQAFAMASIALLVGLMLHTPQVRTLAPTKMESIELTTTHGETRSLHNPEKKLTIVNFFATWCPPCKAEMPHLQAFQENLPKTVELVGVHLAARDNGEQALQNFMTKYNVTYPILEDYEDRAGKTFGVLTIPTTVILNADGQELYRTVGPLSEGTLYQLIEQFD